MPPEPDGELVIHHFDVGQADATLIQAPGATILIDAGDYRRSDVVPYLRSAGVSRIDLFILTHPHADHIGQVPQIMAAFPVVEIWMSGWEHTTQTFERAIDAILASDAGYHEPRAGETLEIGSLIIEVINPAPAFLHAGSLRFLETLGNEIAVAHEKASLYERLRGEVINLRNLCQGAGLALMLIGGAVGVATMLAHRARVLPWWELATRRGTLAAMALAAVGAILIVAARGWLRRR